MKTFIFDTETSGLPQTKGFNNYFIYSDLDKYKNSRLLSICWKIYDDSELVNEYYSIIKPDNFEIDNNSIACKINGITKEKANSEGVLLKDILEKLKSDLNDVNTVVAHNINFDKYILLSELFRQSRLDIIELFLSKKLYCTMQNGKDIARVTFKNSSNIKPPKLVELYKHFFNEEFDDAHNAEADVEACAKCYFKMI